MSAIQNFLKNDSTKPAIAVDIRILVMCHSENAGEYMNCTYLVSLR